jgi:hypothetical protein
MTKKRTDIFKDNPVNTVLRVSVLILLILTSCTPRPNFDRGIIPLTPVNFPGVNSYYDDYNSNLIETEIWSRFFLLFSTNKNSCGNNFDFTYYECEIYSNIINGEFNIHIYPEENSLAETVNTSYNELGPYMTNDNMVTSYHSNLNDSAGRFFYTCDINGNHDIFCLHYTLNSHKYAPAGNPINLTGVNTEFDDGYLTIHQEEISNRETVYFTSNRDNSYDIYCALSEENKPIEQSAILEIRKVEQLSSEADDKCPFIIGNMIVFASNREGGFGGYDLWYSTYKNNEWSIPENFGENINTEYDEFRPVIMITDPNEFINNLMIFSSNRPGGSGRYDLYYVGVNKQDLYYPGIN